LQIKPYALVIIIQGLCRIPNSHNRGYEDFHILGYNAVYSVENRPTFRSRKSATCFRLVSSLSYSSTLKMEATRSPETSVEFYRAARRCILEDRTLRFRFVNDLM
jgi:hypothetical protein